MSQYKLESSDNLGKKTLPSSSDGWAARFVANRTNYDGIAAGAHSNDLAQEFVNQNFGQFQITGTEDGHLVGGDPAPILGANASAPGEFPPADVTPSGMDGSTFLTNKDTSPFESSPFEAAHP